MAEAKVTARLQSDADPVLKRELRRNFRDAAEPVIGDVEQSILLMPSHHDGTLRRQVAKTVAAADVVHRRRGPRADRLQRRQDAAREGHPAAPPRQRQGLEAPGVGSTGRAARWHWTRMRQARQARHGSKNLSPTTPASSGPPRSRPSTRLRSTSEGDETWRTFSRFVILGEDKGGPAFAQFTKQVELANKCRRPEQRGAETAVPRR